MQNTDLSQARQALADGDWNQARRLYADFAVMCHRGRFSLAHCARPACHLGRFSLAHKNKKRLSRLTHG